MELDFDELFVFVVHFVRGSLIHPYIVILLENHMIYFQGTRNNENFKNNFTNWKDLRLVIILGSYLIKA